jgi:predicted anti-sigma-YlaC factor YlaD
MSEGLPGHLSDQNIDDYSRRTMSPAELIIADDHLAICDACYRRVGDPDRLEDKAVILPRDLTTTSENATHLRYEQLASYLDDELDEVEREICDVHLQVCQACSEELRDLGAFKAAMVQPVNEQPASLPSPSVLQVSFWRRPFQWSPLQFAGAAAICALLAGALGWSIWKLSRSSTTEVAKSSVPLTTESPVPSVQGPIQSPSPVPSAQIVVTLNDGGEIITLDEQGNLKGLGAVGQSYQQTLRSALTTGHLNIPPDVQQLTRNAGVLMGGQAEGVAFALLDPVGKVVRGARPTFRWQRLEGASAYVVNIFDLSFNKVATSPQLSGTQWTITSSLRAGSIYLWQVTAMKDGKEIKSPVQPAPEARFRVLERVKDDELKRAEGAYANSHLVLGTLYAQAGLLDDAGREFRALLAANPKSTITQKLLRDVRARSSK